MTKQEIIEKINDFLIEELEIDNEKVAPTADLRDDIGIDSLDYVDIAAFVKKTFGFKIQSEDFEKIRTLGEFYEFLDSKL
ncbi:MAG: acyl carrier protein [Prevotella sp.]|jgi:acyl carrier protein|nr:acyl carrier protein [Prevotella sp.]